MTKYIKKLPAVFQTVTEKKFFDATFDQVFSKKDSDLLAGFIGRRVPGSYNPISDFYVPEPSKNRTWWQLEATAFARNENSDKENVFFYEDLLDRIDSLGGNTLNQDRLFESEYYSWAPPIDFDMFTNYQNYYWVDQGLPTIRITGVLASDIIGQTSYTTPNSATPPNLTLTTGMSVTLVSDPSFTGAHTVENIGNCIGIRLVPHFPDFIAGTVFEFLPWDGEITLSTGRIIQNSTWDGTTWDTQTQPTTGDYITIERGSLDQNAWSRTNKWFHVDTITAVVALTGSSFPTNATRGLRPIIQFVADLELYNSGTQFRQQIQYGFRDDSFGSAMLLNTYQYQPLAWINSVTTINLTNGMLVGFFNDDTAFNFWDMAAWDAPGSTWNAGFGKVNDFIYQVSVQLDGTVTFVPYTAWTTPVLSGDIVFVTENAPWDGAQRGQTWYFESGIWQEAYNDKVTLNQSPLFQLYDHNGVSLDDPATYPSSMFAGSKIFSYKTNTTPGATVDPVLKFPIVYTSLGQASDIMFQNNLLTDRYTYSSLSLPISGYYYYKTANSTVMFNDWNLYSPCPCADITPPPPINCIATSKQRVIDRYVVGYGTKYEFKLSVTPYGYPASPDLIVTVNDREVKSSTEQLNGYVFVQINNDLYVDLSAYMSTLLLSVQAQPPVVEMQTYTHDLLAPSATGYFAIPQQLEANPSQLEVTEISGSDLSNQFASIIANQIGFAGVAFGGTNNYRDSRKNRSVGQYILQNVAPLLKTMLVSSSDDLDFITAERFSQDEYTKFKNKYLRTALQLINQGFNPIQYHNNTIVLSQWVGEILKIVNISKEFSNAFAYSYMIASGSPHAAETHTVPVSGNITLTNFVDLTDPKNGMYIYDTTGVERLLLVGVDYDIVSTNLSIEVQFTSTVAIGDTLYFTLYQNPLPAYVPSTPSKLGTYPIFVPRIELDTSYVIPTNVIIGHDGSKTIAYGDYRDQLLLELECRIYNLLQPRFRNQYNVPLLVESVKSGYFRSTRYSRAEYMDITESYLNKWSAKNRANYRANDWASSSITAPTTELWKLYNYRNAKDVGGTPLNLPGNWKGIFQYYFDTFNPNTRPWEMLGFSAQPVWWVTEYGAGVTTIAGQTAWPNTVAYAHMWADLAAGLIRQGPRAVFDPITLLPQPQIMWARPTLSAVIPVDASGELIPVTTLFNIAVTANPYEPFDGFDSDWVYGDGSPVEQAWMSTSAYAFSVQEFLYLMRPGPFGELMWDTVGTEISPGAESSVNWQYVQNDAYTSTDPLFAWMRPKNKDQIVHGESVDGIVQVRSGYQQWISDRILFLGKDVTTVFGQKIRTLDVNLANKVAGFINKDTTTTYIEAVSPGASTNTLVVPTNNVNVLLHKSPPVAIYSYSGVVIRALADGTFAVYGYDLMNSEFVVLNRSTETLIDISVGGTPAEFKFFNSGETYNPGDIARYNGVYYTSLVTQTPTKFDIASWQKLKNLPIVGGISVTYKPISETTTTKVPYGSILTSAQAVFDLLIGWGAYLESQGWDFNEVNQDTNQISDWLYSAKQFLFWLNTEWAPDASIQVSPAANKASLTVKRGYPNDVEKIHNGVYSILDKFGVAIASNDTTTDRDGMAISVAPANIAAGGIYFIQVTTTETEHVMIFDNTTSFNDIIYSPLLRARQQRLRFNGFRSNGWFGKMEAPGYLIMDNQLVPNYDTIVESMRYFYDPDVTIDNPSLEDLGRHLIGYESKSYLDNLEVSNDVQYLFYQGAIRQKGTNQVFDKLFRSTKVQSNEVIEVYEEWALKVGDFGNTVEQVSTEFILTPEQNTGEVIIARLNYVPSHIGFVKQISVLNAENIYTVVPTIVITAPDLSAGSPGMTQLPVQAKAYAVLDSLGRIARVDISNPGYGYTSAPAITINAGAEASNLDKLYSVWQGEIIKDTTLDNVVNIDIDQTDKWVVRPIDPEYSLELPVTDNITYPVPNAGYVNFNDVKWTSFNPTQTSVNWGTSALNPGASDTIWIANTFTQDWCVYKLVQQSHWRVVKDTTGILLLLTDSSENIGVTNVTLVPQSWAAGAGIQTDFGNMLVLQQVVSGNVLQDNNFTVGFTPYTTTDYNAPGTYTDPDTLIIYNAYILETLAGTPITATEISTYADFNTLLLYKSMRFGVTPSIPSYVSSGDKIWVDDVAKLWTVYNYTTVLTAFRQQAPLINTSLFESASVFSSSTNAEVVQLPVYDPFKNIFPGIARQNIRYMSLQDPARYNVTGNDRLKSNTVVFGEQQVGQLWWDMSQTRYTYYEQPVALDESESSINNLEYRRDHWGQLFPGSTVSIYEWVRSAVPPAAYTGTGVPRDITSYVQLVTSNRFTNTTDVNYFFWVLGATDKPNIPNRTLAAVNVSRLLQSPKSQGYYFFAPIQQTQTDNSYMFYNVQSVLAYQGNNIQVQYRVAERNDQQHTQWAFFREGDASSLVTDQFWDKMVDSLCGYTKVLPASTEYSNAIVVASDLPWDIFAWDVAEWDQATVSSTPTYGEILPVPDPTLSEGEKYGVEYRPRQGMFVKLLSARKVFVQSANSLLKYISIRDDNPGWNTGVSTSIYWEYTNWYKVGFENVVPNIVFGTLAAANIALISGTLPVGYIVQVTNGTIDGRFVLYSVEQLNPAVPTLSLIEVGVENSAIKLLPTIYTAVNIYGLAVELRQLLNAFRTEVMINSNIVDQNELFFAMLNYVMSEQKTPNWLFKSSYIYIKENNLPLLQNKLYTPDQIGNIMAYITDSKPYHTQIRDYTSTHVTSDIAVGTASDSFKGKAILTFGPRAYGPYDADGNILDANYGWDNGAAYLAWDSFPWDSNVPGIIDVPNQYVSQSYADLLNPTSPQFDQVHQVSLTFYDTSKRGYSQLYPYTFTFDTLNVDNPQSFITPENIIGVMMGNTILTYGRDYYAARNADNTYTVYFYNDPGFIVPTALVWWYGGVLQNISFDTNRNELALGYPKDDLVINVDTRLPVDISTGVATPYASYGDVWDSIDPTSPVAQIILAAGGSISVPWDAILSLEVLPNTISFKENTSKDVAPEFYRNSTAYSATLDIELPSPTVMTENIDAITISAATDILPTPSSIPGVVWINGERIEYKSKEATSATTWVLRLVRRGTHDTAPTAHAAGSTVFVEKLQDIHGTYSSPNEEVWNASSLPMGPDLSTIIAVGEYTSINHVPAGGLWYANTTEANFLKSEPGASIS